MCILSYAYLLQVCVLSYFCSKPSFLGADVKRAQSLGRSLRVLATLFIPIPIFIVCHILDGLFHSLSITLLFVFWLHSFVRPLRKCVVYRLPSICLSMAHLPRPNPTFAHLIYSHTPFCLLVSHNKSYLLWRPIIPVIIVDLPYRTKNGK